MRKTRWAAATAAVMIVTLAGCTGGEVLPKRLAEVSEQPSAVQQDEADAEPAADTDEQPEASPDPEPTTTTAERGTRDNPATPGVDVASFTTGAEEVEVELGTATWDADEIVALENQFNDPPADGMVYVLLPVTVSYHGPESMLPWIDIDVTFLADDGRSYESAWAVIPDDLQDVNDIYDGGTATGNILFELPVAQVPGGLWGVSYNWSDPLWWSAA